MLTILGIILHVRSFRHVTETPDTLWGDGKRGAYNSNRAIVVQAIKNYIHNRLENTGNRVETFTDSSGMGEPLHISSPLSLAVVTTPVPLNDLEILIGLLLIDVELAGLLLIVAERLKRNNFRAKLEEIQWLLSYLILGLGFEFVELATTSTLKTVAKLVKLDVEKSARHASNRQVPSGAATIRSRVIARERLCAPNPISHFSSLIGNRGEYTSEMRQVLSIIRSPKAMNRLRRILLLWLEILESKESRTGSETLIRGNSRCGVHLSRSGSETVSKR